VVNKPLEAEVRLDNIKEFSPYRKEKTAPHRYKDQLLNAVCSENHTKYIKKE
jgi:hypothetical protein